MPRLSIKTKLSLVISVLVLSFVLFNAGYYPMRVERQIRAQAETNARQVAEAVGYALVPALAAKDAEHIANVLGRLRNIPSYRFCAVFDEQGRRISASPATPGWVLQALPAAPGHVPGHRPGGRDPGGHRPDLLPGALPRPGRAPSSSGSAPTRSSRPFGTTSSWACGSASPPSSWGWPPWSTSPTSTSGRCCSSREAAQQVAQGNLDGASGAGAHPRRAGGPRPQLPPDDRAAAGLPGRDRAPEPAAGVPGAGAHPAAHGDHLGAGGDPVQPGEPRAGAHPGTGAEPDGTEGLGRHPGGEGPGEDPGAHGAQREPPGQLPEAPAGGPDEGRVPGQHEPRAAHPPERGHRLLGAPAAGEHRAHLRGREGGPADHPPERPQPAVHDRHDPGPLQDRGRQVRAGAPGDGPPAHPGECALPGRRP